MMLPTSLSTLSGDAPGYVAEITTRGGVRRGNCATGRTGTASAPAMMIASATIQAKIGRSIKKDDTQYPANYMRVIKGRPFVIIRDSIGRGFSSIDQDRVFSCANWQHINELRSRRFNRTQARACFAARPPCNPAARPRADRAAGKGPAPQLPRPDAQSARRYFRIAKTSCPAK